MCFQSDCGIEAVNARVDFPHRELLRRAGLVFDDLPHAAVGIADDAAVSGGIFHFGRQHAAAAPLVALRFRQFLERLRRESAGNRPRDTISRPPSSRQLLFAAHHGVAGAQLFGLMNGLDAGRFRFRAHGFAPDDPPPRTRAPAARSPAPHRWRAAPAACRRPDAAPWPSATSCGYPAPRQESQLRRHSSIDYQFAAVADFTATCGLRMASSTATRAMRAPDCAAPSCPSAADSASITSRSQFLDGLDVDSRPAPHSVRRTCAATRAKCAKC